MSAAKVPRLNNKSSNGNTDANGNGKKIDEVEEWIAEDGTR